MEYKNAIHRESVIATELARIWTISGHLKGRREKLKSKVNVVGMRYLRNVFGKARMDRHLNETHEDARKDLGKKEREVIGKISTQVASPAELKPRYVPDTENKNRVVRSNHSLRLKGSNYSLAQPSWYAILHT
uniref:Uncharacterized protein n=1 Tax=Timema poppense TaxID=170557 RepID=A0A7R9HAW8_TIMPO|nr:unnamed protein product [Timema poppensis]